MRGNTWIAATPAEISAKRAAREAGLLTPKALEGLLNDALKLRPQIDSLLSISNRVADAGIPPMTKEERNSLTNIRGFRSRKLLLRDL